MPQILLLEIGTEEIPARFIPHAIGTMNESMDTLLQENRISHGSIKVMGTPRRLVIIVQDVNEQQEEIITKITGPPKKAAFKEDGTPTMAAIGFARSQGVDIEELKVMTTEKGEYVYVEKHERGDKTINILPAVLKKFLSSLSFPKSMKWNRSGIRFARPVRWILALFGEEAISLDFAGIKSDRFTRGHHFMSPDPIEIKSAKDYLPDIRRHFVIVDHMERKNKIEKDIEAIAAMKGGRITGDGALLEEVTFLTEYPVAVCGIFDTKYLVLPRELLITVLREHEKCFSIEDAARKLLPYFVAVSNIESHRMDLIVRGYERVIGARLADAEFFFHVDTKKSLDEYASTLNQVIFMAGLGTMLDKQERLKIIGKRLVHELGYQDLEHTVVRASTICKADLMTEMVGEFPELQGIMGREYALYHGETEEVASAIYEHYLPRFSGDSVPETPAGKILSIADKIDNIIGCFVTGNIPTGSNDPYAVRRQALGIINILIEGKHFLSLKDLIHTGIVAYGNKIKNTTGPELIDAISEFFRERLYAFLVTSGYRYDCVRAVLSLKPDDIYDAYLRIRALNEMRKGPEFVSLAISFKRVINIIPADFKGIVKREHFVTPEELNLYTTYEATKIKIEEAIRAHNYDEAFRHAGSLKPHVDLFFDKVLVMDKDETLRNNRLALLKELKNLFFILADFSKIVVEGNAV